MKEIKPKIEMISVYSNIDLKRMLFDRRVGAVGIKFGTVEQVCRQYGITCTKFPKFTEFSAPKLRLQMFIEKLHFSKASYWM